MIEIIDKNSNKKFIGKIVCCFGYGECNYVIYSISRNSNDVNIFISKIIKNSKGYSLGDDFYGGEREILDNSVARILSRESIDSLKKDKIVIIDRVNFYDINKFDYKECYVTTFDKKVINDVISYYDINDGDREVVIEKKEISFNNKGNLSSLLIIVFGILVLIFCIVVIIEFLL